MRTGWTPSIVPNGDDQTVYLVKDDLGRNGAVWREADAETTDLETVITDLMSGEYRDPVRVVAFNTSDRWSEDVSEDVAREIQHRCNLQLSDVPSHLQEFVDRYVHPAGRSPERARRRGRARGCGGHEAQRMTSVWRRPFEEPIEALTTERRSPRGGIAR
jgi:hypothetical protein